MLQIIVLLASLTQLGPVMYLEEDSMRLLLDDQVLVIILEVSKNNQEIVPGVKSIASQMILDCKVKGRQRIGGSVGFAEDYARGKAVVVQPGLDSSEWMIFDHKSAALTAWYRACIF
jgi:hypothetical protein